MSPSSCRRKSLSSIRTLTVRRTACRLTVSATSTRGSSERSGIDGPNCWALQWRSSLARTVCGDRNEPTDQRAENTPPIRTSTCSCRLLASPQPPKPARRRRDRLPASDVPFSAASAAFSLTGRSAMPQAASRRSARLPAVIELKHAADADHGIIAVTPCHLVECPAGALRQGRQAALRPRFRPVGAPS